jgi:hypothetical protein
VTDRQGEPGTPFDAASWTETMEKMMAQMGEGCDCAEMMSRMMSQAGQGCCTWGEMMSQVMATCCGAQDEPKSEPAAEATQQA